MSGQQHSPNQTPPNQQPPQHRQNEFQEELKKLREQNQQLRGQVDYMAKQINPAQNGQQEPEQSPFEPQVQQAIQKEVDRIVKPIQDQFQQRIGFLMDQNDQLSYQLNYGGNEKFEKLNDKVEEIRRNYQSSGRYITREQALQMAYFEETGKKAQPDPTPSQDKAQPKFDPYFGTFVDPETGLPTKEDPTGEPEQSPEQFQQAPQQFQPQMQQPQMQQPQQFQQPSGDPNMGQQMPGAQSRYEPTNNMSPFGQQPQLPGQGQPPQQQTPQQGNARIEVGLESSDADLQAFEQKFGDIEF